MSEIENPNVEEKDKVTPVAEKDKVTPVAVVPPYHPLKTSTPITVVKVESIKLPVWTAKDVETTGMSDNADTYIQGVPNYGEADIDVIYLATQANAIKALRNITSTFVVTYPNSQIDTFSGWINSLGNEITVKDKIKQKIKVRATSDVVSTGTVTGTTAMIGLGTTLTITGP